MDWKKTGLTIIMAFLYWSAPAQTAVPTPQLRGDSNEVNLLLDQSKQTFGSDPAKAIELSEKAMDLSQKIKYGKGLALAYKYIGIGNYYQGNNVAALDFYQKSITTFRSLKDEVGVANILSNIGAIYKNQGDDAKALNYFLQSLELAEKTGDKLRILTATTNIGAVYGLKKATHQKALQYLYKALPLEEELGDKNAIGTTSVSIGAIYADQKNYDSALYYFKTSLKAFGNSENSPGSYNAIGDLYNDQGKYGLGIQYHNEAYNIAKKLNGKLDMVQSLRGLAQSYALSNDPQSALKYFKEAERLGLEIGASLELQKVYTGLATTYSKVKEYNNAFVYQQKVTDIKDTIYNTETDRKLANLQFDFDLQKKEGEITILKKDNILRDSEIKRQRFARNAFGVGLLLAFLLALLIYRNYRIKAKNNIILDKKNMQINSLLLNILPEEIAEELEKNGKAKPRHYDDVSVLFTDFKGFTTIADKLTPEEVVAELNTCFEAFDDIVQKHNLEKIKTIGDSYMCAGNIPTPDGDHVCKMIKASLEMLTFIDDYNSKKIEKGKPVWDIRIGVHVGPVVAGVVGKKKYAYDIWGSTVNIASRMESNGMPGMVNISATTYEKVKNNYACDYRGKLYAKNVGDIDMYFISHEIIEFDKTDKPLEILQNLMPQNISVT
ncbi:MAG: adenylate/guanylate cyclase domain-containing protein [Chitinophagaceae bacterium]